MRVVLWNPIAALVLTIGTGLQAYSSTQEYAEDRKDLMKGAVAVRDLHEEFRSWRRPLRWWRNRKVVAALLEESRDEAEAYRKVRRVLWGWSLMFTGSLMAFIGTIWQ